MTDGQRPNYRLAKLMAEAGFTSHKSFARAVRKVSEESDICRPIGCDHTSVSRWLRGMTPRPDAAQCIATALSHALGRPVTIADAGLSSSAGIPLAVSQSDAVAAAADEASADPIMLAAGFDPESVAWLWDETRQIARAANRAALDAFNAARRVRCHAVELAERTRRPSALSDLYVISGQATALMASAAFDLNRWDESATLARSAVSYGSVAGHASLQAWVLGLEALLANWRDEPDAALDHVRHGLQLAPAGTPRVRLRYIEARSHALLGDVASAAEVLDRAQRDRDDAERHEDPLSEETGGEFAFGRARAEACAAAAWLDLGRGTEALDAAQRAVSELAAVPKPRLSLSQLSGARIDMATACVMNHDLAGADEALRPVLAAELPLRNVSLSGRLARARAALLGPPWAGDVRARALATDIDDWLAARPPTGARKPADVKRRRPGSAARARG